MVISPLGLELACVIVGCLGFRGLGFRVIVGWLGASNGCVRDHPPSPGVVELWSLVPLPRTLWNRALRARLGFGVCQDSSQQPQASEYGTCVHLKAGDFCFFLSSLCY